MWSVLDQDVGAGCEVVVVNDSGRPLPQADWHSSPRVKVVATNRRERSFARNTGAAMASGEYLHFLDDDDWLLPGALKAFHTLAAETGGAWLMGAFRFVDDDGRTIRDCHPDYAGNCFIRTMVGEWLPLQASLIRADVFFPLGGFAPLESLLGGDEDVDLARLVTLRHDVRVVDRLVAAIRRGYASSTTRYDNLVEQSRQSRDKVLGLPGAFSRLHHSAHAQRSGVAYWHGRLVTCYLGSLRWNLRRGRFFTAASRGSYALAGLALCSRHIFSRSLWSGLTDVDLLKGLALTPWQRRPRAG